MSFLCSYNDLVLFVATKSTQKTLRANGRQYARHKARCPHVAVTRFEGLRAEIARACLSEPCRASEFTRTVSLATFFAPKKVAYQTGEATKKDKAITPSFVCLLPFLCYSPMRPFSLARATRTSCQNLRHNRTGASKGAY